MNNPFAVDGERPQITMGSDGEWNDEQLAMYDQWEEDNYDEEPDYNGETSEERRDRQIEYQKLK